MIKNFIYSLLLATWAGTLFGQKMDEFPLYENGKIPNSRPAENQEKTTVTDGVEFTTEISIPTLQVFQPKKSNGQAVIICPGGSYWGVSGKQEGRDVAQALNKWGITAFVLRYRTPDPRTCDDPSMAPLQDAQQAIRRIRKEAGKWNIHPDQIGIMGFSAGGHLAATAATHFNYTADGYNSDPTSLRPDFVVLVYPVISFEEPMVHTGSRDKLLGVQPSNVQIQFFSNEKLVDSHAPPAFIVHAQDDPVVPVANSIAYFNACTEASVPAEMHIFQKGGHGFGMNKNDWMNLLEPWLSNLRAR